LKRILPLILIFSTFFCSVRQPIITRLELPATVLNTDHNFIYGWQELQRDFYSEAIKFFEKIPVDTPLYLTAYGFLSLRQNKLQTAEDYFQKALQKAPFFPQALLGQAMIFEIRQNLAGAYNIYNQLLLAFPENQWLINKKQKIKEEETAILRQKMSSITAKDSDQYLQLLELFILYNPEDIEASQQLAELYLKRGATEKGLAILVRLYQKKPADQKLIKMIIKVSLLHNEPEKALIYAKKLEQLAGKNSEYESLFSEITQKLQRSNLPEKIKSVIFKEQLNRSELAGIIYHYFAKYLQFSGKPEILTDINSSEFQQECIILASLKIIEARADHRFDIYGIPNRNSFVIIIKNLFDFLSLKGIKFNFLFDEMIPEPVDISPEHRYYDFIRLVVKAGILSLDEENKFQPSASLNGLEALTALKTIKSSLID